VSRPGLGFKITTVIAMTTASLLVMWLADQITQHGVGNGTSLIIMINITSRLPVAIIEAWTRYFGLGGITAARSPVELLLLLIFGFLIVMGTVMLTQGVRKVPIHSTRRSAPAPRSAPRSGRIRFACAAGLPESPELRKISRLLRSRR